MVYFKGRFSDLVNKLGGWPAGYVRINKRMVCKITSINTRRDTFHGVCEKR